MRALSPLTPYPYHPSPAHSFPSHLPHWSRRALGESCRALLSGFGSLPGRERLDGPGTRALLRGISSAFVTGAGGPDPAKGLSPARQREPHAVVSASKASQPRQQRQGAP